MVCGGQCVVMDGMWQMPMWSADNSDTPAQVCADHKNEPLKNFLVKPGATARTGAVFGQGIGPILLDEVMCTGLESRLFDCPNPGIQVQDCSHPEDAGVTCLPGTSSGSYVACTVTSNKILTSVL